MSASLFESLQGLAGPGVARAASAALDEHEMGAGKTLDAAFAAVLYGLERNAGDASVMGEVAKLIGDRSNDTSILNNVTGLVAGGPGANTSLALGERLLGSLFGGRTEVVGTAVARASGVGQASAARLFPVAGSLVLATLGKRLGAGVPPANAVAGLIANERTALNRLVPPYLSRLIGSVRDGGTKAVSGAVAGSSGLRSVMWLAIPLALLLGLVWFLLVPDSVTIDPRQAAQPPRTADRDRTTTRDTRTSDRDTRPEPRDTRKSARDEPPPPRPRATSDWTFDTPPARKSEPDSSSTWTAPAPTWRKGPPLPGLLRVTLANGTEIDVVPTLGVEPKLIAFIDDRYSIVDKTKWFDFDRIRFRTGASELTPGSKVQLRNTAAILKSYPNVAIKIGGYTDNVGDPSANLKLSDERAKSVMAALIKFGVSPDRLDAEGYGDQHPIADNATPEGRAKNRRTAVSVRAK